VGKKLAGIKEIMKALKYAPAETNVWRALLAVALK
jgi:hypothetical protein